MFDLDKINALPADEKAEAEEGIRALLRSLQSQHADARDGELVWIQNPFGVRDVVDRGYWRTYLSRKTEEGYKLLEADQIEEEEAKVRQSHILREEKQNLWAMLAQDEKTRLVSPTDCDLRTLQMVTAGRDRFTGMSLEDMSKRILELEEGATTKKAK